MGGALVLSPKQKDYYNNSNAQINISHGAVRSGKTFITNLRWLKYIQDGPPGRLLMSGRTKSAIKENVLDDLFEWVGTANYHYVEQRGELTIFGRKIKVVGADDITAEKSIRGRTYAGWYGDEITIQHPSFVKQAITRCSVTGAQIFWTTNPDHPKHEIKSNYIDDLEMAQAGQVRSWHFLLDDNYTLSDSYKRLLKASFSGVFYKRNIEGLWVIADGVVYGDDYNPKIHKLPHEQIQAMIAAGAFREYIGGADFGHTHPMVGGVYGVKGDPLYPEYYQISEFYKTKQKTENLRDYFLTVERQIGKQIRVIYCDSAEPDRIVTLQDAGLRATGANKQLAAGINTVQVCFKNNRLFISDQCENTDTELQTYRFPDDDDPKARRDLPLDEDNHAMDMKRYAIHNYELQLIGKRKAYEKAVQREAERERLRNMPRRRGRGKY